MYHFKGISDATKVALHEHETEVESKTKRTFTRSQRTASLTEYSKSALTDHGTFFVAYVIMKKTFMTCDVSQLWRPQVLSK